MHLFNFHSFFSAYKLRHCNGGNHCCGSGWEQCGKGEGDCDTTSSCQAGLTCGTNNCEKRTLLDIGNVFDSHDDCCW